MSRSSEFETICFQQKSLWSAGYGHTENCPPTESGTGIHARLPASFGGENHETVQPNAYQCLLKGEGLTHLTGTGSNRINEFFVQRI